MAMNISNYSTKFITRDNEILNSYFKEIRKYNVLSNNEIEKMYNLYKNGTPKERDNAREAIVLANQRFIISLAKRYAKDDADITDYVNEGNIGLIIALDKYNPAENKETKFLTYAVWYIRREMNRFLHNDRNMINRSNNMKLMGKIDKVREKFFVTNGYNPTDEDVIDLIKTEYNIVINDIRDVYNINLTSINEEINDDFTVEENSEFNEKTLSVNSYEDSIENEEIKNTIVEILSILPEKHQIIIKKIYGINYDRAYSENEIASEMKIDVSDVHKLVNKIILYIQQNANKKVA